MTVGALVAGVSAETIVPRAAAAVRELTTVEASDLEVVSGAARVIVRFTGDDDAMAERVAEHTLARMKRAVAVNGWRITRRDGSRWIVL
jgi:hypothetical protein